jgi:gluconate 5-dehydrogenase
MLFNIKGKKILVTGSTAGLGLVMAEGLAREGAFVILNGRTRDKVEKTVGLFLEKGYQACGYAFDISNAEEVEHQMAQIEKDHGIPDVLVNNAGIQKRGPLEEFKLEDWNRILNTNLTGAFIVTNTLIKGMIMRQKGKIINICSLQSELARPSIAPYATSKAGLNMLTKSMATEWAKHNIQVNAIGPGYFKTELTKALWENPEFDAWLCNRTPAHRWGNPEELLGALIFLASDASSYVNGQILYVDGGMTACV